MKNRRYQSFLYVLSLIFVMSQNIGCGYTSHAGDNEEEAIENACAETPINEGCLVVRMYLKENVKEIVSFDHIWVQVGGSERTRSCDGIYTDESMGWKKQLPLDFVLSGTCRDTDLTIGARAYKNNGEAWTGSASLGQPFTDKVRNLVKIPMEKNKQ